jgi:cell shape-determining protein MreC
MIVVKKNNKELTILESQKDSYLALGYNVLDTEGNIAEVGRATEYAALKEENSTLKAEVAKQASEIAKLKRENKRLKSTEKE